MRIRIVQVFSVRLREILNILQFVSQINRSFGIFHSIFEIFSRPIDYRREIWITNSGNERIQNLEPSHRRVFCEDHFDPKYLRRQFNRTILRKDAIPYPYGEALVSQEVGEWFRNRQTMKC